MIGLLVGCPVRDRKWILPTWFDHVKAACSNIDVDLQYVFVVDNRDHETLDMIHECAGDTDVELSFVDDDDFSLVERGPKYWSHNRFRRMVYLRNQLLDHVRLVSPHFFFSLDSDILIHPDTILNLIESTERFDAVGARTYMGRGKTLASYMLDRNRGPQRGTDTEGVFNVDIIMAAKMMTPKAYGVDYEWHGHGEDVGWSRACRAAGLTLGWDGRTINKHILHQEDLHKPDKRYPWDLSTLSV